MIVEGAFGAVVAKVGGEAVSHCAGTDGAAFQFEEEGLGLIASSEHEEGVGVDGALTAFMPEVARSAVRRVHLYDVPPLVSR